MSYPQDILRFTTAGNVDDGKSTLIGRLLLESKSLYQDQVEAITSASRRRGDPYLDLALFTDGLKAEREQRITIDVAYRYFSTSKRKFIIADCPGHVQYTRNMVTGASTAELAIILLDAQNGLTTQSKRHTFLASLLNIPHLLVAVNKMDLVDFSQERYLKILEEFRGFASRLQLKSVQFLPISALHGDNIVTKSSRTPWYDGATLLHFLESVNIGTSKNSVDFRLPVQYVIRPHQNFRGFSGRIASGRVKEGDEIISLPSGLGSRVKRLSMAGREIKEAFAGDSVLLELEEEIDISRGDLLVRRHNLPQKATGLDTTICWLSESAYQAKKEYLFRFGTREILGRLAQVNYLIDVNTMHRLEPQAFQVNDIGRAQLHLKEPVFYDPYHKNRETGSFVMIDPTSHNTVGAGMVRGLTPDLPSLLSAQKVEGRHLTPPERLVSREEREKKRGHQGGVVWLTGLSGSGKSTIAIQAERRLFDAGMEVMLLDGDSVRGGLCSDLGFSAQDRRENIRRVGETAALLARHGVLVLCAFISPFQQDRERARALVGGRFLEVHVDCPLKICESRDPKGLYAKARRGELSQFTGLDSPYEAPSSPELTLDTQTKGIDECASLLISGINKLFAKSGE